jgi:hypothetical protein
VEELRSPRGGREADEGSRDRAATKQDRSKGRLAPFLLLCLRDEGSYGHRLKERLGELLVDETYPGRCKQPYGR